MSKAKLDKKGYVHGLQSHGGKVIKLLATVLLVMMWLPMVTLVILSVSADGLLAFPPQNLTLEWYVDVLTDPQGQKAIYNTLKIGLVATPISISVATLAVIGIDRYEFRGKPWVLLLAIAKLLVPGIVGAIAVFQAAETVGISGYWLVVFVHIIATLPFSTLVMLETFSNFDESLEAAAMDLGANELTTFRSVTVPNMLTGIIATSLLTFTFSFNEFIFTYFVRDSGSVTLPVYLWNNIVYGLDPSLNAISVIFLGVATSFLLLAVTISGVRKVAI
ncbi:ABC transporter permease [Haloarcula sp. S1CR25-12]|uniref:ABC transporter permease n=1 Tax=Haloarcula saliterrae TaxID=2950534 RepID=A0ABU2FFX0_9EURY|nr:ABC transporter permease [Haloarcula sp. S1CR25-12]MDS0261142.1 ABC transporter permease [Haloarcula sp. S1CR25-12]